MPYWGSGAADSDYAFDAVGVYVSIIKDRMFVGAQNVIDKQFPEQAILASLKCIRMLANEFPKCVGVQFGSREFDKARKAFDAWFGSVQSKLPQEYRVGIALEAQAEFELFESTVLRRKVDSKVR